ncbi:MAG: hypothetical protein AAF939_05040 [Planctomycetota bacterium]
MSSPEKNRLRLLNPLNWFETSASNPSPQGGAKIIVKRVDWKLFLEDHKVSDSTEQFLDNPANRARLLSNFRVPIEPIYGLAVQARKCIEKIDSLLETTQIGVDSIASLLGSEGVYPNFIGFELKGETTRLKRLLEPTHCKLLAVQGAEIHWARFRSAVENQFQDRELRACFDSPNEFISYCQNWELVMEEAAQQNKGIAVWVE